ncbi:endocuticle structural glycoprotein SgAbd-8-like [Agrilus planipennis]|uniref:Endocuticle structural glycoprotein SgAbd-8-like n=1 Tax=Agrilus planipennis TaxID=224129 RepID=A0A1W4XDV2_AGRPL|nr:endocuticle structural glycoprotein SgAbd-8-like [Agrilus planipennis]
MKFTALLFSALIAAVASQTNERDAPIISQKSDINPDGSYSVAYETGNGITAGENGILKSLGPEGPGVIEAQGYYQYTAPEGQPISLQYTADENGYHPQGEHLPTPPPVPEAIQKAVQYILANEPQELPGAARRG